MMETFAGQIRFRVIDESQWPRQTGLEGMVNLQSNRSSHAAGSGQGQRLFATRNSVKV
jgi:hypothetical protein